MNEKKISFIMCWNNEYFMNECKLYLDELVVPEGYEVDVVEVTGAKSMTAGYNEGMHRSDAKYKVYLHQDVFIINKNFIIDLLDIFQSDTSIGMIGMVGTPCMAQDGTMWHGMRYGGFYRLQEIVDKGWVEYFYPITIGYMEVEAVDGLLMATQYDIPWREDLFKKWDFYDVSQSFEFLKAGYKVVVPGQNPEWYIHDCGIINLDNYGGECNIFLENYAEYMAERKGQTWKEYLELLRPRIVDGFHGDSQEKEHLLEMLDEMLNEDEE